MILDAIEQVGGIYLVTADHGNAEDMVKRDKKGNPLLDKSGNYQILTSHTLQPVSEISTVFTGVEGNHTISYIADIPFVNQVPLAIGGPGLHPGVQFRKDVPNGGLANVAATFMNLHGFEAPSDYEPTLIEVVDT